ncbi:MAG TPA: hypothetical protein VEF76_06560 [Patescibacteria group bacterium]|nr:hypothetical protein [Patescibacteria group bacterium]
MTPVASLSDEFSAQAADAVADVIRELKSGFDSAISVGPSKTIDAITLAGYSYDPWAEKVVADIEVHSTHESQHGDTGSNRRLFSLTLAEVHRLTFEAPEKWRPDVRAIEQALDGEYQHYVALRQQSLADTAQQMAKLEKPVAAPKAASFSKKRL